MPEVLGEKGSSKRKEVTYTPVKDFPRAATAIARAGSKKVVYTESPESRLRLYKPIGMRNSAYFADASKSPGLADFSSKIQAARRLYSARFERKTLSHEGYTNAINYLNALERTVANILKKYPGHTLGVVIVHHNTNYNEFKKHESQDWHEDDPKPHRNTVSIVATLDGKSTQIKGYKKQTILLPDNSMVAFGGATHRGPKYGPDNRTTLVLELWSRFPTKR